MSGRNYGESPIVLTQLVVAPYTYSTDTVGDAVTLPEQMTLEIELDVDHAVVKSGGAKRRGVTVVTGGKFKLSSAGLPWDALDVLTDWTLASPSTGVETYAGASADDGAGMPFFAIAGRMLDSVQGDLHVGFVCCQLDAGPSWKINENNEFLVGEMSGESYVPSGRKPIYVRKQQTGTAISLTTLLA